MHWSMGVHRRSHSSSTRRGDLPLVDDGLPTGKALWCRRACGGSVRAKRSLGQKLFDQRRRKKQMAALQVRAQRELRHGLFDHAQLGRTFGQQTRRRKPFHPLQQLTHRQQHQEGQNGVTGVEEREALGGNDGQHAMVEQLRWGLEGLSGEEREVRELMFCVRDAFNALERRKKLERAEEKRADGGASRMPLEVSTYVKHVSNALSVSFGTKKGTSVSDRAGYGGEGGFAHVIPAAGSTNGTYIVSHAVARHGIRAARMHDGDFPDGDGGDASGSEGELRRRNRPCTGAPPCAAIKSNRVDNETRREIEEAAICQRLHLLQRKLGTLVGSKYMGPVPGIMVGDEFSRRAVMQVMRLHMQLYKGIDYCWCEERGMQLATAVVLSGLYPDRDDGERVEYEGEGGQGKNGSDKRQSLTRGNRAMCNSIVCGNPVSLVRSVVRKLRDGRKVM